MKLALGALLALALMAGQVEGRGSGQWLIPDAAWDCGMAGGIPSPERGRFAFEIHIPLERAADIGRTPYGQRRVAVGKEGSVRGGTLKATVMPGTLDYELVLANGVIEIEQLLVLRATDGSYLFLHTAGVGADAKDTRVVVDIEAPTAGPYAALNSGHYVARRTLNAAALTLSLRIYDVTAVAVDAAHAIRIVKPAGVPAQPWDYRRKGADEQQGEMLIRENVTLGPGESLGASKHGIRNIIPITGGVVSGRINGKVLMGGADYQHLSPPVVIDAHYLWQAADGEIIIVRNTGPFGALVPTFETRVDGPYAYLNQGLYLSSNPGPGQGGVGITMYESRK
ncbi:MAG TPA: DUF3237 family protein [Steroidobacteraceae bacterium]|nr:DUF3237 family protein [Steroidobacteraceae bacterium]